MGVLSKFSRKICRSKGGNAAIIVALGMPALMGGAGLAVDTAQWYLWQRELQYAADQAAIAGAWARGNGDTGTVYLTRATQEFSDNLSITVDNGPTHSTALADYNGGTQNSVVVSAEVTASLPFASFLMGRSTTIRVNSQATFEVANEFEACLLALDKDSAGAVTFNGGPVVNSNCGLGAISTASGAIEIKGNSGTYNVGSVATGGTVIDIHGGFGDASIVENDRSLFDPYEGLTPPDNPTPRSLTCTTPTGSYKGSETTVEDTVYTYLRGRNRSQATPYDQYDDAKPDESTTTVLRNLEFNNEPLDQQSTIVDGPYQVDGSGPDKIFEIATTTQTITYNVVREVQDAGAQQPGTYSDFTLSCDTTLAGGIYVIDGGELNVNAQYELRGSGVMFVLKNGAGLQINGGATVNLSAMTANELIAVGVSADDASQLEGMLIFEDPDSDGSKNNTINGNANTALNGTVYLPNSDVTILGTTQQTSQCLMVASKTINIGGTADLLNFCPAGLTGDIVVGGGVARVRLVA